MSKTRKLPAITQAQSERLFEFTGTTDDIDEALDQWVREREALQAFADEAQACRTIIQRLWKFIEQDGADKLWEHSQKLADTLNASGTMFLDPKVSKALEALSKFMAGGYAEARKQAGRAKDTFEHIQSEPADKVDG